MPVIRLNEHLYDRLALHATGFSTPAEVIERLLDTVEGVQPKALSDSRTSTLTEIKPELYFFPDEKQFRKSLVEGTTANVVLHFTDGSTEDHEWNASRFSETSNLRGNIWSGFLRGWKSKNIRSADFHMGQL